MFLCSLSFVKCLTNDLRFGYIWSWKQWKTMNKLFTVNCCYRDTIPLWICCIVWYIRLVLYFLPARQPYELYGLVINNAKTVNASFVTDRLTLELMKIWDQSINTLAISFILGVNKITEKTPNVDIFVFLLLHFYRRHLSLPFRKLCPIPNVPHMGENIIFSNKPFQVLILVRKKYTKTNPIYLDFLVNIWNHGKYLHGLSGQSPYKNGGLV